MGLANYFDDIYGEGSLEEFREVMSLDDYPDPEFQQQPLATGGVRIMTIWPNGCSVQLEADKDNVHFNTFNTAEGEHRGQFTRLAPGLSDLFKGYGVKSFSFRPLNDEAKAIFTSRVSTWKEDSRGVMRRPL